MSFFLRDLRTGTSMSARRLHAGKPFGGRLLGTWPDHTDPGAVAAVGGLILKPEVLFRDDRGRAHSERADLHAAVAVWAHLAGMRDASALRELRDQARPELLAVLATPQARGAWRADGIAEVGRKGSGDADSDASDEDTPQPSGAPLEWRLMVKVHGVLARAVRGGRGSSRRRASTTAPDAVAHADTSTSARPTPGGERAAASSAAPARDAPRHNFQPSRATIIFWHVFPWAVAAVALVVSQLYTLAILETYLEPRQLAPTWLLTSAWGVVQGWLIEPVIILARNNLSFLASRKASKVYQFLEQLGCGTLVKSLRDVVRFLAE